MIMISGDKHSNGENPKTREDFTIHITSPMLYDRLHILSAEYSVSVELLVNIAVKRLSDDVDFIRDLRAGMIETE